MGWKKSPVGVLAALLGLHLLAHVDRNMLLGFSPQITADLGLSNAQYGFLVGAVWVLSFGVMAVFMGTLADRFSRPRVIAAGVAIWSACTWASGHAESLQQMVAARFLVASGEAALVPAAIGLLLDLFPRRQGTVIGLFFMGIPLGIGGSFLLAGTAHDWRAVFEALGFLGAAAAVPLAFLGEDRGPVAPGARQARLPDQLRAICGVLRHTEGLPEAIAGFVLVHMAFAGLSFAQIWLVRDRGLDAAAMATRIGVLQLTFGALGALVGGALGDRLSVRLRRGQAGFLTLLVAVCAPLMIAFRFARPGSPLFYAGMCAGFFMPLAAYGPANALIQGMVPASMRSTIAGVTMFSINLVAIALGNLAVGVASDHLPLTWVLLATDLLAASAALFFLKIRPARQAI